MNIVCFKVGDLYSAEHVNKLYNMVKRNTTYDFNLICFTEQPKDIEKHIDVRPLPCEGLYHWWNRMALFKKGVLSGPCINIDLDVVIHNNIDEVFELDDSLYMVPRNWIGGGIHIGCSGYNDCVVKFNADKHNFMWDMYQEAGDTALFGTQVDNAMTLILKLGKYEHKLFPQEWFWRFWNKEYKNEKSKFCHFSANNDHKQHTIDDEFVKEHWT